MNLRSAKYVNNTTEAHVKEPNKEHGKDHAGETSEGHGRDQGKEAHQPLGATPGQKVPPVQAPGSREGSKEGRHQDGPRSTKMRPVDREVMAMPEWLIHRYHQEGRIDERRDRSGPAVLLCHRSGGTGRILQINTGRTHQI
jgi:hypothetical protein